MGVKYHAEQNDWEGRYNQTKQDTKAGYAQYLGRDPDADYKVATTTRPHEAHPNPGWAGMARRHRRLRHLPSEGPMPLARPSWAPIARPSSPRSPMLGQEEHPPADDASSYTPAPARRVGHSLHRSSPCVLRCHTPHCALRTCR